jgi:DNA-binding transcriptional regulator YhcF (GntR family)
MLIQKRLSYVQIGKGYQTYIFTPDGQYHSYKYFDSKEELEQSIAKAKEAGFKVVDATKIVQFFNRRTKR